MLPSNIVALLALDPEDGEEGVELDEPPPPQASIIVGRVAATASAMKSRGFIGSFGDGVAEEKVFGNLRDLRSWDA